MKNNHLRDIIVPRTCGRPLRQGGGAENWSARARRGSRTYREDMKRRELITLVESFR
jgi:hypothetical protein